jgi:hypothetical protein
MWEYNEKSVVFDPGGESLQETESVSTLILDLLESRTVRK